MGLRTIITALCAIGLYASVFMLRKSMRAERGELAEPSVVQTERARLFGGQPNAVYGAVYYLLVIAGVWLLHGRAMLFLETIALLAAGTSAYLAYSLLFVTRMSCPYCWTAHAINWTLALLLPVYSIYQH
ncbi:MAG: vitamin K epoxide reductase family protein [Vulcanimicrobiaceae bacterium]